MSLRLGHARRRSRNRLADCSDADPAADHAQHDEQRRPVALPRPEPGPTTSPPAGCSTVPGAGTAHHPQRRPAQPTRHPSTHTVIATAFGYHAAPPKVARENAAPPGPATPEPPLTPALAEARTRRIETRQVRSSVRGPPGRRGLDHGEQLGSHCCSVGSSPSPDSRQVMRDGAVPSSHVSGLALTEWWLLCEHHTLVLDAAAGALPERASATRPPPRVGTRRTGLSASHQRAGGTRPSRNRRCCRQRALSLASAVTRRTAPCPPDTAAHDAAVPVVVLARAPGHLSMPGLRGRRSLGRRPLGTCATAAISCRWGSPTGPRSSSAGTYFVAQLCEGCATAALDSFRLPQDGA